MSAAALNNLCNRRGLPLASALWYKDGMEFPKIRWIDAHPFIDEGREMVLLNDAEGIMEGSLIVSKNILFIISLMDGSRSLREIQAEYVRNSGELLYMERLEEIVAAMDQNYLLLSENYRSRLASFKAGLRTNPCKKACPCWQELPGQQDGSSRISG